MKYLCPMHPEVVSDKPGRCPKCGMNLIAVQKKTSDVAHPPSHKASEGQSGGQMNHHGMMAADFKRRFFIVLPLTLAVLALHFLVETPLSRQIFLPILGSIIALYGGWPFFAAAKDELKSRNWGMMTLVSLAVLSGYFFSVAATFLFPGESLWWEISTLVLAFLFGHWMEMRAVMGAGSALTELTKLIPPTAHLRDGGDVKTEELKKGDVILVKPGEKIPIDGEVLEGESTVNEAMVTGESRPIVKKKGDKVIGGTINNDGSLTIEVTKVGAETAIFQIRELIEKAQETKPAVQKLADRAATWLTLIAIVVGLGTFVYWFLINPQGAVFAATLAISVIVITCPHALGIAIPTVTTVTSTLAAKNGILIRDMKGLEVSRRLNYIVLDKTGTLTEGNFRVVSADKEALRLAAAVEVYSQHPIAKAVIEEAKRRKIKISKATNFKSYSGRGVEGMVGGAKIEIKRPGVSVFTNGRLVGTIEVEDKIRPESRRAIEAFHKMGLKIAMLTGDKKEVGEKVGKTLGIDTVFSEVLPEDKVKKVKELQQKGDAVGMVGDGVNDAPALTQANVGIAIGAGTDVAIESAEIVLVKNNPLDIVKVIALSQKADAKMKQNLAWATGYNLLAIPAAAGVFAKWGVFLRPEWGALLMSASSLIVVANALLLRRAKI